MTERKISTFHLADRRGVVVIVLATDDESSMSNYCRFYNSASKFHKEVIIISEILSKILTEIVIPSTQ